MANKCKFRIQTMVNPSFMGRKARTYMVLGSNANRKAVVKNFRTKREALSFVKKMKKGC